LRTILEANVMVENAVNNLGQLSYCMEAELPPCTPEEMVLWLNVEDMNDGDEQLDFDGFIVTNNTWFQVTGCRLVSVNSYGTVPYTEEELDECFAANGWRKGTYSQIFGAPKKNR
jgi:hypothetical protein